MGSAMLTQRTRFYFMGSYVCANFGENRSRNATVRVHTDGSIHRYTERLTDATDYNLSHAMCYSYGTENENFTCV